MAELMQLLESTKGYARVPRFSDEQLTEVQNLISNKMKLPSWKHELAIREAMTTSDFPLMFGDIIDRKLMAAYLSAPRVMSQVMQPGRRTDFRLNNIFDVQLAAGIMTEKKELNEYHETSIGESHYQYAMREYGEKVLFSWRVLLNDNLGAFNRLPQGLAQMAINTEERFLTSLYFGAGGPLAAYFAAVNGGAAVSALPLTLNNLQTAIGAMLRFNNASADAPIDNSPMYLMVGPGNYVNALSITGTTTQTFSGGAAGIAYPVDNVIRQFNLKVLMNPWIPFLVTGGTVATTCWCLFSDPNKIAAGELGKLAGHETPDIYIKDPDMRRLGGGDTNPMDGDWMTGSVGYLGRICLGGCTLNGRAGWASNGQ